MIFFLLLLLFFLLVISFRSFGYRFVSIARTRRARGNENKKKTPKKIPHNKKRPAGRPGSRALRVGIQTRTDVVILRSVRFYCDLLRYRRSFIIIIIISIIAVRTVIVPRTLSRRVFE